MSPAKQQKRFEERGDCPPPTATTWKNREPADTFFRRMQDFWLNRAERSEDDETRAESEAEALLLDDLIGQFGKLQPR